MAGVRQRGRRVNYSCCTFQCVQDIGVRESLAMGLTQEILSCHDFIRLSLLSYNHQNESLYPSDWDLDRSRDLTEIATISSLITPANSRSLMDLNTLENSERDDDPRESR
jgi:hypothetical protein